MTILLVRKGLFVEGLTIKNRGHLGSRYINIYIYIHVISLNIPSIHLMLHEAHVFFFCVFWV